MTCQAMLTLLILCTANDGKHKSSYCCCCCPLAMVGDKKCGLCIVCGLVVIAASGCAWIKFGLRHNQTKATFKSEVWDFRASSVCLGYV